MPETVRSMKGLERTRLRAAAFSGGVEALAELLAIAQEQIDARLRQHKRCSAQQHHGCQALAPHGPYRKQQACNDGYACPSGNASAQCLLGDREPCVAKPKQTQRDADKGGGANRCKGKDRLPAKHVRSNAGVERRPKDVRSNDKLGLRSGHRLLHNLRVALRNPY
jgi:hypothetical protein